MPPDLSYDGTVANLTGRGKSWEQSGDFNRKALSLHHGVLVADEFMEAVRDGAEFV